VRVRFTRSPADVERADLVVIPGTKATVEDLERPATGSARAGRARAAGGPILGICGGYQLLGERIEDDVESGRGALDGLGLLPVSTASSPTSCCAGVRSLRVAGDAGERLRDPPRRVTRHGGEPLFGDEGCRAGAVVGTSWHGALESDDFRRALLALGRADARRRFVAGAEPFAPAGDAARRARRPRGDHLDTARLAALIEGGPPAGLPR
jgi:adenosylcobyric acid synthase